VQFSVIAARPSGEVVTLELDAADRTHALRLVADQGLDPIAARKRSSFSLNLKRGKDRFPLLLFTQELISLLEAGLTLMAALQALHEKDRASSTGRVLSQVLQHLNEGRTFSHALETLPAAFPAMFVSTVRASERTGDLVDALERYVRYMNQIDALKRKVINALIYPALLLSAGVLVVVFLMFYVVPKFSHIYEDMGDNLPLLSRLLMEWGRFLEMHAAAALAVIATGAIGLGIVVTRPPVKAKIMATVWAIPALGERIRIYQLSRFYRTLGMLLRSGIPIITALDMASGILAGPQRAQLGHAALSIREGHSISDAMEHNGLSTPIASRLMRVGEESGRMGDMMERVAMFYDDEMARWIEWATRLFEPMLMAFIGVASGGVVVLMYMPIFELAGSIQ